MIICLKYKAYRPSELPDGAETLEAEYQINPSTDCVVIAAAKNIDGVWGEVNVVRFTTLEECEGYNPAQAPVRKGIAPRTTPRQKEIVTKGLVPKFNLQKNKVQLTR